MPAEGVLGNADQQLAINSDSPWICYFDFDRQCSAKNGEPYFYNMQTRQTVWACPVDEGVCEIVCDSNAHHTGGSNVGSASAREMRRQQEEKPLSEIEQILEDNYAPKSRWLIYADPDSSRFYYFDAVSQQTSWDLPQVMRAYQW